VATFNATGDNDIEYSKVYNAFAIASVAGGKELPDGPGSRAYCLWGNFSA
jgi:hypothetical protein